MSEPKQVTDDDDGPATGAAVVGPAVGADVLSELELVGSAVASAEGGAVVLELDGDAAEQLGAVQLCALPPLAHAVPDLSSAVATADENGRSPIMLPAMP